jgi:hypothetical protein
MRIRTALIAGLGIVSLVAAAAAAEDVQKIVRRLDGNQVYGTLKAEAEFLIQFGGKKIVKRCIIRAKGSANSFVEFTNPEDAGTKFLKKDGNLFLYSPDAEEIIPITGHLLRESMMGSDLSYEDAVGNDTLESLYDAAIVSESDYEGKPVWVIDFRGKRKTIAYPRLKMWVEKDTFIPLKTERYALSGAILKEELVRETKKIGGRDFPVRIEVRDLLRKDSKTVLAFDKVELDAPMPDSVFSMRNLQR